MNRNGPIIIIEDDEDDRFMFSEVFTNLRYPNPLHFFPDGLKALEFLNATDINPQGEGC